eukprot:2595739-Pleurochrysis_carterae.AAC.1
MSPIWLTLTSASFMGCHATYEIHAHKNRPRCAASVGHLQICKLMDFPKIVTWRLNQRRKKPAPGMRRRKKRVEWRRRERER